MFGRGGDEPGPVSMLPKPGSRGYAQASADSTRPNSSDLSDLGAAGSEVPPEWVLRRVDDVITEHFFKVEGMLDKFRRSIDEQQRSSSQQQEKVQEILTQVAILIEAQTHERRKGRERDQQLKQMQETLSSKGGQPLQTLGRALQRADDLPTRKFEKAGPDAYADGGNHEKVLVQIDDLNSDLERHSARQDSSVRVLQGHLQVAENEIMSLQGEVVMLQKRLQLQAVSGSVFSLKAADISRAERLRSLEALEKKQASLKELMQRAEVAKTQGSASALLTELGVEGKGLGMASSPLGSAPASGLLASPSSSRVRTAASGDTAAMNSLMEDKLNTKYQQYGLGDNEEDSQKMRS